MQKKTQIDIFKSYRYFYCTKNVKNVVLQQTFKFQAMTV